MSILPGLVNTHAHACMHKHVHIHRVTDRQNIKCSGTQFNGAMPPIGTGSDRWHEGKDGGDTSGNEVLGWGRGWLESTTL